MKNPKSNYLKRNPQESTAAIAQLGERQTEDLKVPGSIPGRCTFAYAVLCVCCSPTCKTSRGSCSISCWVLDLGVTWAMGNEMTGEAFVARPTT